MGLPLRYDASLFLGLAEVAAIVVYVRGQRAGAVGLVWSCLAVCQPHTQAVREKARSTRVSTWFCVFIFPSARVYMCICARMHEDVEFNHPSTLPFIDDPGPPARLSQPLPPQVAVKKQARREADLEAYLMRELAVLKHFQHENLLQYVGASNAASAEPGGEK